MKKFLVFILFIQFVLLFAFKREHTFISDSLLKAIQGVSLVEYGSENLIYPGIDQDSNYKLFIFDEQFSKKVNNKYIGQYPILFSIYSGIIFKLPLFFISIFSILFFLLSIFFLNNNTKFSIYFILLYFTSSIINNSHLDLNEASLFFLLNAIGFSFIYKYFNTEKYYDLVFGLFFISTGTWLRLESVLFFISSYLALFVILKSKRKLIFLSIFISALPIFGFLLFNHLSYGNILGPRYFFNFTEEFSLLIKIKRIISMSLFFYDSTGLKMGLFFVMPILLLALIYCLRNRKKLNPIEKFSLILFGIQFVLISITAPNDGITFTSRYHILEIIPGLVLVNFLEKNYSNKKVINSLFVFSLIYQLFISIGFILFFNEIKKFQKFALKENPDTYITKNPLACGSLGLEHLQKKIFCFKDNKLDFIKIKFLIENGKMNKVNFISEKNEVLDLEEIKKIFLANKFILNQESEYKTVKSFLFTR